MKQGLIEFDNLLDEQSKQSIRNHSLYLPLSSDNDTIWQHMRVDYFEELLSTSKLYMKPVSFYEYGLERSPLTIILEPSERITKWASRLNQDFESLRTHSYLSCWYRNPYLVDGIFNRFTKDKDGNPDPRGGIAIKTSAGKLIKAINSSLFGSEFNFFYCGLVYYLPRKSLEEYINPFFKNNINKCTEINTIVPFFFKKTNFGDENEFRIVVRHYKSNELLIETPRIAINQGEDSYLLLIQIEDALEGFAIPARFGSIDQSTRDLLERKNLKAIEISRVMDGYRYFKFERIV